TGHLRLTMQPLRRCAPTARPDGRGMPGQMRADWVAGWRGIRTVAPNTYQTAFKKLRSDGLGQFAQARVFYGELAWSQAVESSEYLTISLNAGEWKDEKLTPYQVIVHWLEWSAVARGRLKNELEVARKEGMEAKKAKQASRSFLFFIGNQDAKKPALFHVQDHRLICTLHDELVFPAYSRTARR
ncbi:hypothetical protein KUC60_30265, partial [Pseudomonas aeruginosa]|uniref:hypothetical protein n=1 Tax=Pseudomonas aeruginosa TaxID=287 RepID=UPI0021E2C32C